MPEVDSILSALRSLAKKDAGIRDRLLEAGASENPVSELCRVSRSLGYPLYEMDLVNAGEEYYANMRRSTNGGGENSPLLSGEDDYFEIFMAELKGL